MRAFFPKQRLTYKEKSADDFEWVKRFVNSIVNFHEDDFCWDCDDADNSLTDKDKANKRRVRNMLRNYRLFNNQIDQKDFTEYCDSLGVKAEIGAIMHDIKPYNKTYNKINVLLGEEYKRPDNHKVILTNAEGIRAKLEYKNQMYRDYFNALLQQEFFKAKSRYPELDPSSYKSQEEYNQAMQQQEQEIQQKVNEVLDPEQIEKYMKTDYLHAKEILASNLLTYLNFKESLKEKKNDGFKHGNISGEEHVWVGIENGEPVCKLLNSAKVFYHKSPEVKYIQYGMYAGYRTFMAIHDVLDIYCEDLTDDQKDLLEDRYSAKIDGADKTLIGPKMKYGDLDTYEYKYASQDPSSKEGSYGPAFYDDIEVIHVEWVSQRKVGFLTYINEQGVEVTEKVDEAFEVPDYAKKTQYKDESGEKITTYSWDENSLEWEWVPEVWEATRIDTDIFTCIGPKANQHYAKDNPYRVKLGYHGVVYNNMNAPSQSSMDKMVPFQYLFFIAMDRFKSYLAKDKGKIMGIDSSRLDPAFPIEKTIHFLEQAGYYIYNGLQGGDQQGSATRPGLEAQDLSTLQHIINFAQILAYLDKEIGDAVGVTQQREGQASTYDAVTNVQQNIIQTSYITEPTFIVHDNLWREVKQSLIEVAQVAYEKKPLITQYVLNDGSRAILEIDEDFNKDNTSFGIFVTDSSKEAKVFEEIRGLVQPLIQSDRLDVSDIINMLTGESTEELKRDLKKSEDKRHQREDATNQAQQQHEKELQQMQHDAIEDQQAHQVQLEKMKSDTSLAVAQIQAMSKNQGTQTEIPFEVDTLELEKEKQAQQHETKENAKDRSHEASEAQKQREFEAKQADKDRQIKEKEIAVKKIAARRPKSSK